MKDLLPLLLRVFAVVLAGVLMAGLVVVAFGDFRFESTRDFSASFADVSGLKDGQEVKAAGVPIGRVNGIALAPDNTVSVDFSVSDQVPVTVGTQATIRYKNLIGDRYLELAQGPGPLLAEDGHLPPDQTHPALDLDELYNGFAPLFQGLAPQQINELSGSLIQILQGQAGAVQGLLDQVGSLTNGLADRDQLIGSLVTNLNTVLDTANRRSPELVDLIDQLQRLVTAYAQQREPLGEGLERVNGLAATIAGYLPRVRPDLAGTINQVDRLSQVINADSGNLNEDLKRFPAYYNTLSRLGAYTSAFNFYICGVSLYLGPQIGSTPVIPDQTGGNGTPRCKF